MVAASEGGAGGEDLWRHGCPGFARKPEPHPGSGSTVPLDGQYRYRDWAISQLDFYANNYLNWPLQNWNGKARMMSQSLDEAAAVIGLIDAVRLLTAEVKPHTGAIGLNRLFVPIVQNLSDFNQGVNILRCGTPARLPCCA